MVLVKQNKKIVVIKKPTDERYNVYNLTVGQNITILVANKPLKRAQFTWKEAENHDRSA